MLTPMHVDVSMGQATKPKLGYKDAIVEASALGLLTETSYIIWEVHRMFP